MQLSPFYGEKHPRSRVIALIRSEIDIDVFPGKILCFPPKGGGGKSWGGVGKGLIFLRVSPPLNPHGSPTGLI